MDLKQLAKEYLDNIKHMQLATVDGGKPWICTVYFVADDDMSLYWTSGRDRQHSKEILADPKAAVTIVKDADKKQALQMSGEAHEVLDADLDKVHKLYQSKFGHKDYDLDEMRKHQPEGRSYWFFIPSIVLFWDEVNFPNSPKQEYPLT